MQIQSARGMSPEETPYNPTTEATIPFPNKKVHVQTPQINATPRDISRIAKRINPKCGKRASQNVYQDKPEQLRKFWGCVNEVVLIAPISGERNEVDDTSRISVQSTSKLDPK